MLYANVAQLKDYEFLPEAIKKCFEYAKAHDLMSFEKGSHPIEGEDLFVNIVEYETTERENRFWEAHKKYLDVHLMLMGEERIDLGFVERMEQKEFVEKDDFLPLEGRADSHVVLKNGDFLICYPQDGHMTAIQTDAPSMIKKAIFKVKI